MTATAVGALAIMLAGALARRFGLLGREQGELLVRIVLYLGLPPLIFLILAEAQLDVALLLVPLAGWLIHLAMVGVALGAARGMSLDRPRTGALVVASAVGNTGFFGVPLIAASGDGLSLEAAVMYDAFATGIITWTSTVAIASAYGDNGQARFDWGELGRALLLPPNWGLAAGLAVNLAGVDELPELIERPCEILAAVVLPLVMIYAGLMLDTRGLSGVKVELAFVVVTRLGLGALLGLGIGLALGLDGATLDTVVIMAAMPTALMSLVLGGRFGLRTDVIAGAVVATTLLATATLPALRAIVS